ncbi:MAG: type IV toxin-antitoxin system AbiEi family antitoxin domain-containing protein [Nocardioidaceae bacterium]|nr:type IV toxin-antitoxin system AbiEi family antitoxin domain-containing protein [Nocardioidaceae bacterium]
MDWLAALVEERGFFTRAEAIDAGYDDRAVTRAVRSRWWHRIRRGYYTFTEIWAPLDDVGRHRVRAHAVAHSLGPGVALSHTSGAIEHGIAVWGLPLDRVHVTRLDGAVGRIEGDVVHHVGRWAPDDVMEIQGVKVMVPGRCAVEVGCLGSSESALVSLDSALALGLDDEHGLFGHFARMERWPDTRRLQIPIRMADPGAKSPGESRGRWLFLQGGIPAPLTQFQVFDASGELIGTSDWAWPTHGLLGEFDGKTKYGRLLQPGQDPGEVVFAEKHREDRMREASGCAMVRLIWSDYDRPRLTVDRIRSLLRHPA